MGVGVVGRADKKKEERIVGKEGDGGRIGLGAAATVSGRPRSQCWMRLMDWI